MITRKKLHYDILLISIAIFAAIFLAEFSVRNFSGTTGSGAGKAHQRWMEKYWAPVNELGYRDYFLSFRIPPRSPSLIILGDSFSAGHGVEFDKTFASLMRSRLYGEYEIFNVSHLGASTKNQIAMLDNFKRSTSVSPYVVFHQYYMNDIEDYVSVGPQENIWLPLEWIGEKLSMVNLIIANYKDVTWGKKYKKSLVNAYANESIFGMHLSDLNILHNRARAGGAKLVFIIFPDLYPNSMVRKSKVTISQLESFFHDSCHAGDVIVDIVSIIEEIKPRERVVSLLDGHPSATLHESLAAYLSKLVTEELGGVRLQKHHSYCARK